MLLLPATGVTDVSMGPVTGRQPWCRGQASGAQAETSDLVH